MTNAQAALIAAASQIASRPVEVHNRATGSTELLPASVATKLVAAEYLTWLDQQDTLERIDPS